MKRATKDSLMVAGSSIFTHFGGPCHDERSGQNQRIKVEAQIQASNHRIEINSKVRVYIFN
jgi:hypothetical protein